MDIFIAITWKMGAYILAGSKGSFDIYARSNG